MSRSSYDPLVAALIHRVVDDDHVQLFFPQYGPCVQTYHSHLGHPAPSTPLVALSTIQRTRETLMHGGIAGGVRRLSEARVAAWWRNLMSDALDVAFTHDGQRKSSELQLIRDRFKSHIPEEQPQRSLDIARTLAIQWHAHATLHAVVLQVFGTRH